MKKIASLALAMVILASCQFVSYNGKSVSRYKAKGDVVTRNMDLKDFQSVVVNGHADITFVQGQEFQVEVSTNEDVFDMLDYKVEDGMLILQTKDHAQIRTKKMDVLITAPYVTSMTVNGAADVDMDGYSSDQDFCIVINGAGDLDLKTVTVPSLKVEVNGAGDIDVTQIEVARLNVMVCGAGDARISGHAGEASIQISGAGDVDVRELACDNMQTLKGGIGRIKR